MAEEPEENVARLAEAVLDDSTLTDRKGLDLNCELAVFSTKRSHTRR